MVTESVPKVRNIIRGGYLHGYQLHNQSNLSSHQAYNEIGVFQSGAFVKATFQACLYILEQQSLQISYLCFLIH
jgi:hypothetical protein